MTLDTTTIIANIKGALKDGETTITFKKVNGDVRVMRCTTKLDLIPPSGWPTGKNILSEEAASSTIRAYDLQAQGWRSFKIENFISIA